MFAILIALSSCMLAHAFSPLGKFMKTPKMQLQMLSTPGNTEQSPVPASGATAMANFKKIALPVAALFSFFSTQVLAEETAAPAEEKAELGPPPVDFGITYDFYADAQKIVNHMRYAVQMEKGNAYLAQVAQKVKDEMVDFVSFYRNKQNVAGRQSFSLLYTSINVLAGHYTSYGVKFPVPEKRRKRLLQEFKDIEKNIRKKR